MSRGMAQDITKDAIIIGGGLSGGLAALALARAGLEIALIDAQAPETLRAAEFDGRTTALAYASARLFRRLGLWSAVERRAEPIRDILVTDGRAKTRFRDGAASPLFLHFDSRELKSGEPLGFILENRDLRNAIFDKLGQTPSVSLFAPATIEHVLFGSGTAQAKLAVGKAIEAPLILAADGKKSALRAEARIKVNQWSYPQTGIIATIAHEHPHKGVAHEFFLPSGPFAVLPMTARLDDGAFVNRSSLVWTERKDAAAVYLGLEEDAFAKEIENRVGDFLGAVRLVGPRAAYPLSFHLSQRFTAPRLALLGDAARAIHPIAGQGFNLAVKDIAALADILEEAASLGLDIGHQSTLMKYERWRRFDSASLALATDAFNRLFSNDFGPLRLARDLGMGAVGRVSLLRRFFMRHAGADLGKLPTLMAPE
ncbi:MAG: UbiH/UbiF/VisC/COQ6 family ubiquinone biosynthesis hydroxylase [Amphiplicatus sp.]